MPFEEDLHRLERVNVLISLLSMSAFFVYHILVSVFVLLTPVRYRRKKDVSGKRVLITGAGSGLGRQLAFEFSRRSACLLLLDVDREALLRTSSLLDPDARVSVHVCDVSKRQEVYATAERIKDEVGEVDIVVNNAGIVSGKSFIDLPDESIRKTMQVNALSHFWICKAFLPSMMARNSGHIVTIASIASRMAFAKLVDYCASKYAANGFSEALEVEMFSKNLDGIKVTVVCPYLINTELFAGAKNNLVKTISVEQAAEEIMEGILMEKETVFIPSYFKYLVMLKALDEEEFRELTRSPPTNTSIRTRSVIMGINVIAKSIDVLRKTSNPPHGCASLALHKVPGKHRRLAFYGHLRRKNENS